MAVMDVRNDANGWLVLWLEPLGEDRWMKPGETFRIRTDYTGDELAFSVTGWVNGEERSGGIENLTVWVEGGGFEAEVTDEDGNPVECGHNRPPHNPRT
ncbi:hypothetical protein ACIO3O_36315 [Streptomyces sp. NPDC087440]|uniref:hypothetical protein n=1 Tax=Streptomyces sp. NPDC087440 TaxID=3365790 RepID=UPI0037FC6FAF